MYVVSLSLDYDPLEYTCVVWGSGNGYSVAQHIYQHLISFTIGWSIHIFYKNNLIKNMNLKRGVGIDHCYRETR